MAETALTETTDTQTPEHEVILTETAAAKVASLLAQEGRDDPVSYTHLTLPTTPYV